MRDDGLIEVGYAGLGVSDADFEAIADMMETFGFDDERRTEFVFPRPYAFGVLRIPRVAGGTYAAVFVPVAAHKRRAHAGIVRNLGGRGGGNAGGRGEKEGNNDDVAHVEKVTGLLPKRFGKGGVSVRHVVSDHLFVGDRVERVVQVEIAEYERFLVVPDVAREVFSVGRGFVAVRGNVAVRARAVFAASDDFFALGRGLGNDVLGAFLLAFGSDVALHDMGKAGDFLNRGFRYGDDDGSLESVLGAVRVVGVVRLSIMVAGRRRRFLEAFQVKSLGFQSASLEEPTEPSVSVLSCLGFFTSETS